MSRAGAEGIEKEINENSWTRNTSKQQGLTFLCSVAVAVLRAVPVVRMLAALLLCSPRSALWANTATGENAAMQGCQRVEACSTHTDRILKFRRLVVLLLCKLNLACAAAGPDRHENDGQNQQNGDDCRWKEEGSVSDQGQT